MIAWTDKSAVFAALEAHLHLLQTAVLKYSYQFVKLVLSIFPSTSEQRDEHGSNKGRHDQGN
ncbi:hypothetical protein ABTP69_19200, partial [Acinetobacter baumannii]